MTALLITGLVIIMIIIYFIIMNKVFYNEFKKRADQIISEAGKEDPNPITEDDLSTLPEPVARYIRFSGLVGLKRMSSMRIVHSGTFKPGADKKFMPIRGEYFLTTKKPSFCWYGKITMMPGLSASAFDSYYGGHGRMVVKLLSAFKVVDTDSEETGLSAFGRCVAEMTLIPSFFLDKEKVKWIGSDSSKAECQITDASLITNASLHFNIDGSLDKIVVDRYFERDKGEATLEKFTGKGQDIKDFNGLKLASVVDGYWNLKEGDLHYVHFIIDKAESN